MTGEFSTYECEVEMGCGHLCTRLFGHQGIHICDEIQERIEEARAAIRDGRLLPGKTAEELLQLAHEQRHPGGSA